MRNVARVVHDIDHDQLHLLGAKWSRTLPSRHESIAFLERVVAAACSADDADVVLAYSFSNLFANHVYAGWRADARTQMVYPLYGQTVSYERAPGEYYASMWEDPIIAFDGGGYPPDSLLSMVLFAKNPFLDDSYRPSPLGVLLQTRLSNRPRNWRQPRYAE